MKSDTNSLPTRTVSVFSALIQEALWHTGQGIVASLSEEETKEIFTLAEQQALLGLIVDTLLRCDVRMPKSFVFESVGLLEKIKQNSRLVNGGVARLNELLTQHEVDYVMVKGQTVAAYYPDPLLRQIGDIDFYCDAQNFKKAQRVIKAEWGISTTVEGNYKHAEFAYKHILYEAHFSLIQLFSKRNNSYWQQILHDDKGTIVNVDGVQVKTLSPTLHTLYIFLHLYNHLLDLGVGLRQFCDLAILLHSCKNDIDLALLRSHLETLGLEKPYRACGTVLVDYLGLPASELGYELSDYDRKYKSRILDVVFYRGNMGYYHKRIGFSGWKNRIEIIGISTSHFIKFMALAPSYSCYWQWYEYRRKGKKVIRNILKSLRG